LPVARIIVVQHITALSENHCIDAGPARYDSHRFSTVTAHCVYVRITWKVFRDPFLLLSLYRYLLNMLYSSARFTVALVLASSALGVVIPATTTTPSSSATVSTTDYHKGPIGALFKNSVHEKVYLSEPPAVTPTTTGNLSNTSDWNLSNTYSLIRCSRRCSAFQKALIGRIVRYG